MTRMDANTRRAPNAKVDYVKAKTKAKTNRPAAWLEQLPGEQQDKPVKYLLSKSAKVSCKKTLEQKQVKTKTVNRLKQNLQRKTSRRGKN